MEKMGIIVIQLVKPHKMLPHPAESKEICQERHPCYKPTRVRNTKEKHSSFRKLISHFLQSSVRVSEVLKNIPHCYKIELSLDPSDPLHPAIIDIQVLIGCDLIEHLPRRFGADTIPSFHLRFFKEPSIRTSDVQDTPARQVYHRKTPQRFPELPFPENPVIVPVKPFVVLAVIFAGRPGRCGHPVDNKAAAPAPFKLAGTDSGYSAEPVCAANGARFCLIPHPASFRSDRRSHTPKTWPLAWPLVVSPKGTSGPVSMTRQRVLWSYLRAPHTQGLL